MSGAPGIGAIPEIAATLTGANMIPGMASLFGGSPAGVPPNPFAAQPGFMDTLKTAGEYIKPIGQAAGAASQAGLLWHQQPITPSPMMAPNVGGNQILGQLAQGTDSTAQQMQLAEQMRQKRRMGLLGGGYGAA